MKRILSLALPFMLGLTIFTPNISYAAEDNTSSSTEVTIISDGTAESNKTEGDIPQTGDNNSIMPILFLSGISVVLISSGIILKNKECKINSDSE